MVKHLKFAVFFLFVFFPLWLFSQANPNALSHTEKILSVFDGSLKSPQHTFSKFIMSLKQSDLLMYISCMSSQRKREMVQTDGKAKDFNQQRLNDAVAGFKKIALKDFSVEAVSIQASPPLITFTSTSVRGSLFSKEETTLSFFKENEEWLISDVKTRTIEKRVVK